MNGAVADLHGADAQNHLDCYMRFGNQRAVLSAANKVQPTSDDNCDNAFKHADSCLSLDKSHIWISIELHILYLSYEGHTSTSRSLIERLSEYFSPYLLVLPENGVANILVVRNRASQQLRIL